MIIFILAAVDERGGIGRDNRLPWHLSDDLKHFRRLTMGHHVLMGRKTYEGAAGKMPGRKLIVLSRSLSFQPTDAQVAGSLEDGIELARAAGEAELFVIGGAQVFAQALPLAQRLYLTRVHADSGADVFFPALDMADWQVKDQQEFSAGPKNDYSFTILSLEKVANR
ncbi:MAG: dihydrofolate reductase [Anaerolineales bacterium]